MPVKCKDIIDLMNIIAPNHLAVEGDNIGLVIGDEDSDLNSFLIALDIDAGHFATEYIYMTKLCQELSKEFVRLNFNVNISLSNKNKDPISKV